NSETTWKAPAAAGAFQRCGACTSWPRKVSSTHFSTRPSRWSMFFIFLSPSYFIQHCVLASSGVSVALGGLAGTAAGAGCGAAGARSAVLLPWAQAASSAASENAANRRVSEAIRIDLTIGAFIAPPRKPRHRSIVAASCNRTGRLRVVPGTQVPEEPAMITRLSLSAIALLAGLGMAAAQQQAPANQSTNPIGDGPLKSQQGGKEE